MPTSHESSSTDLMHSLYSSHHGWLHRWLHRRLGSRDDAADLAHDTFVRLLSSRLPSVLDEPRAFMRTVAHGLLVTHWRRRDIERAYLAELAARPTEAASSPEQRALIIEALCQVDAMLDRLSAKARRAFLLSQLDGLTYARIASELGVSERMVKRYMADAMFQCLMIGMPQAAAS